jgi:hypothetical protein
MKLVPAAGVYSLSLRRNSRKKSFFPKRFFIYLCRLIWVLSVVRIKAPSE